MTAASTSPLRSSSWEYAWSSTRSLTAVPSQAATSASTSRNQAASESALTATGRSTAVAAVMRLARLGVQEPGLPAEADQPLAVRGRAARRAPADQHLARRRLQRADALADRARRDVQLPGGRVEGAVIGDGDEGVQLARVEVHLHK